MRLLLTRFVEDEFFFLPYMHCTLAIQGQLIHKAIARMDIEEVIYVENRVHGPSERIGFEHATRYLCQYDTV